MVTVTLSLILTSLVQAVVEGEVGHLESNGTLDIVQLTSYDLQKDDTFYLDNLTGNDKKHALIVGIFLLINLIVSVLGNLLVLVTFFSEKPCRKPLRVLLSNLALANLLVAALGEPMVTISALTGKWQFGEGGRKFEAFIVTVGGLFSMADLAIISAERYSRLAYSQETFFNEYRTSALCTFVWIFQIMYCTIPFFGVAEWVPEGIGISNSLTFKNDDIGEMIYIACLMMTGYIVPLAIITFCYVKIYALIRNIISKTVPKEEIQLFMSQYRTKSTIFSSGNTDRNNTNSVTKNTTSTRENNTSLIREKGNRGTVGDDALFSSKGEQELPASTTCIEQELLSASAEKEIIDRVIRSKRAERQIVIVVGMVIISFFVSWTPYAIVNVLVIFEKSHIGARTIAATLPAVFAKTSTLWSPIIYFFVDNEIKSCCKKTLSKMKRWIRIVYFGGSFS